MGSVMGSWTAVQAVLPVTNSQSQPLQQSVCMSLQLSEQFADAASLSYIGVNYIGLVWIQIWNIAWGPKLQKYEDFNEEEKIWGPPIPP